MSAITISSGTITIGSTVYHGLNYEAWSNDGSLIFVSRQSTPLTREPICRITAALLSSYTINGVTYTTTSAWIKAFNRALLDGAAVTTTESVTLAGGGNETDTDLTVTIGKNGSVLYQFVDVSLGADCTIDMEESGDGTNWVQMINLSGNDVTGVLVQSDTLIFNLVDIAAGTQIRPKFVTNTTGAVTVTIKT